MCQFDWVCPPGHSCDGATMTKTLCTIGKYGADGVCVACPMGRFSTEPGAAACTGCPSSTPYSRSGAYAGQLCSASCDESCAEADMGAALVGSVCPAGLACHSRTGFMVLCRLGYFSPAGASDCSPCPSGRFMSPGGAACMLCPATLPYSFQASASEAACMCPPGHTCATTSTPLVCPEGTFSPAGSLGDTCQPCPPYTFSPRGSDTCMPACPTVLEASTPASLQDIFNPQGITVLVALRAVVVSLAGSSTLVVSPLTPEVPGTSAVSIGTPGSGGRIREPPQFILPRAVQACPWSNTTVLVVDSGNGRVVEVDVDQGVTVKEWITGIDKPYGVAASTTLIAVSQATTAVARVLVYDLGGTLVTMFGGAPLSAGDNCCAGVQLGFPSSLAVHGAACLCFHVAQAFAMFRIGTMCWPRVLRLPSYTHVIVVFAPPPPCFSLWLQTTCASSPRMVPPWWLGRPGQGELPDGMPPAEPT